MLLLTGQFAGKTYEKPTPVSARAIATYYDLPFPADKKPVFLQLNPKLMKRDRFGQSRKPKSTRLNTTINCNHGDDSFVFTYQNPQKGGALSKRIVLDNVRESFDIQRSEQAVFCMLHPICKNSPFHIAGMSWTYELLEPEVLSQKRLDANKRIHEISGLIMTLPWDAIKMRASGMVMGKRSLRNIVSAGETETRNAMIVLLNQNPDQFAKAWDSVESVSNGLLYWALDNHLIVSGTEGNRNILRFSDGVANGGRITYIQKGSDNFKQLQAAVLANPDIMAIIQRLYDTKNNNASAVSTGDAVSTSRPITEPFPLETNGPSIEDDDRFQASMEKVQKGILLNILEFDPINGTLYANTVNDPKPFIVFSANQLAEFGNEWQKAAAKIIMNDKGKERALVMYITHTEKKAEKAVN